MKKILFIGSVAALVVVLALFALGKEPRPTPELLRREPALRANEFPRAPLAESLPIASAAPVPLPAPGDELNATRALAEKIAKELLVKNPDGPELAAGGLGLTVENPEALIDDVLSRELGNFDLREFRARVSVADLAVVSDSPEASRAFLERLSEILAQIFGRGLPAGDGLPSDLAPFAAEARRAAAELRATPVPARLAPTAARTVELITAYANLFAAIAAADADPFRALLALQAWQPTREEFVRLLRDEIQPALAAQRPQP